MVPYSPADLEHAVAMKILLRMTCLAASRTAALRDMARLWVQSTGDTEGGIQWVAACLGRRPSVLTASLIALVDGTPRERASVRKRLEFTT